MSKRNVIHDGPLSLEHRKLYENHLREARGTICKYWKAYHAIHYLHNYDLEEAIQNGLIALVRAVRTYNPLRGYTLNAYADITIRRALFNPKLNFIQIPNPVMVDIMHRRKGKEVKNRTKQCNINKAVAALQVRFVKDWDDLEYGYYEDTTASDEIQNSDRGRILHSYLNRLDNRLCNVLKMRYGFSGKKMDLKDVAKVFGVSKERIRQLENEGLRRVKELMVGIDAHDLL